MQFKQLSKSTKSGIHFVTNRSIYLAAYQFCAHLASTARSTLRMFLPPKGFDMQSTTMAFATSSDSDGPSKMTSSWTCFPYKVNSDSGQNKLYSNIPQLVNHDSRENEIFIMKQFPYMKLHLKHVLSS